jgi:acetoin utilization deacetylase AcuC-like enzyme
MWIYASDRYVLPLPAGHRFPMGKYAALRERVKVAVPERLREPPAATDSDLLRAHAEPYMRAVASGTLDAMAQRRIGFPWTPAMVERSRRSAGATIAACRSALATGLGANLAGGTHHAHHTFGAGFCVFNDAVVAARAMQAENGAQRVLIVDLDVHQGDGTAALAQGDRTLFTFSMHGRRNFPFRKCASDLDVELEDGTGDGAYLSTLRAALGVVLTRFEPDLAIYLAGADPYVRDRLGRLALSKRGLALRDRIVLETLRQRDIPVAIAMAGGYAEPIQDSVDIHASTIAIALELDGAASATCEAMRAPPNVARSIEAAS